MKVALFSRFPNDPDAPRGGVETVTLGLTRALAARDDLDVHVVTLERGRSTLQVEPFDGATIHRLPGSRWPQMFDILCGPGRATLRRYLLSLGPDVLHCHETYGYGLTTLPIPMVFTIHGFDHANIPAEGRRFAWLRVPLWKWIESSGLKRLRQVISITPYVREHIEGRTNATIHDIENPLQPAFFQIERRPVAGRVFFAGWITPRKNPIGLVKAFAPLVKEGLSVSLHLAGEEKDPPYAQELRDTIRTLGVESQVQLLGRVPPAEIRKQLSEAEVFVLPSLQENAPMAISEAMAAGVPVISSNRCGMVYMIDEGATGYLVDPDDLPTMTDRLRGLLTDDPLNQRMSSAARQSAFERFHPDSVASRTVAVYEQLVRDGELTGAPTPS